MLKPTFAGSLMFPSEYVAAEDLQGKDVALTIAKVEKATLRTNDKKTKDAFLIHFDRARKPLVLNKTNARTIAQLHGTQAEKWVGKRVALYPTTCDAFGQTTTCIRIRDRIPGEKVADPADGLPESKHGVTTPEEAAEWAKDED
jgi:hypothetical protein